MSNDDPILRDPPAPFWARLVNANQNVDPTFRSGFFTADLSCTVRPQSHRGRQTDGQSDWHAVARIRREKKELAEPIEIDKVGYNAIVDDCYVSCVGPMFFTSLQCFAFAFESRSSSC